MKLLADIVNEQKNSSVRTGGFTPHQWVLGKHPRIPGSLLDENEYGQLGVIQEQVDGQTVFSLRAQLRFTARKCFVKQDCGRRVQTALLRNARPQGGPWRVGDFVMFK